VIVDLGTGDGRAVLARANADPRALVIGVDAVATSMSESSRRAFRGRRAVPNALYLAAAAESLPAPLTEVASLVTITLPWGSLLRGVLGSDRSVLGGIASIVAPGGRVEVLASVVPTDHVEGFDCLDLEVEQRIAAAWRSVGFELKSMHPATREDIQASRSTWARRLGDRPAWRLDIDRTE
jgi:16S rRNA (adenine(1408)-N(1))-methyltransferase